MKGNIKSFVSGCIVTATVVGLVGSAAATVGQKTVALDYNDIKVTLDGKQVTLVDSSGQAVEPFAIDGTTYLPVRAVSDALGLLQKLPFLLIETCRSESSFCSW